LKVCLRLILSLLGRSLVFNGYLEVHSILRMQVRISLHGFIHTHIPTVPSECGFRCTPLKHLGLFPSMIFILLPHIDVVFAKLSSTVSLFPLIGAYLCRHTSTASGYAIINKPFIQLLYLEFAQSLILPEPWLI